MLANIWTAIGVVTSISIFLLGCTYALGQTVGQFKRMVLALDQMISTMDKLVRHVSSLEERVRFLERVESD